MYWHTLDPGSSNADEAMLAKWIADVSVRTEPYWLLAHAMNYRGFQAAGQPMPVMLQNKAAILGSRFQLRWIPSHQLKTLIGRLREDLERFQLDAPRAAERSELGALKLPEVPRKFDPMPLLGLIDDGVPFAHPNLLQLGTAGTIKRPRTWSIWDQGRTPDGVVWSGAGVPFGSRLTASKIKNLVGSNLTALDERQTYRRASYKTYAYGTPHGSGVAHLLAGSDPSLPDRSRRDFDGVDACAPLLAVQLPESAIRDTAGAWLGFYALSGLRDIVQRAWSIALRRGKAPQIVINLSYGSVAGPHDGTTMFELAMDELVDLVDALRGKLAIVLAAGNAKALPVQSLRVLAQHEHATVRCFVPPDNPREGYVEFWIPERDALGTPVDPAAFTFTVQAPDGSAFTATAGTATLIRTAVGAMPCGGVAFAHRVAQGMKGTMVLLMLRPTRSGVGDDRAPAGIWTVTAQHGHPGEITLCAWVERNDMVGRARRAQQVRFVDEPADARYTLSHCAHGQRTFVVGAVRQSDNCVAAYSGSGFVSSIARPDWYAASDRDPATSGVLLPGWLAGQTTRMSGTSIAAPWVARWLLARKDPTRLGPTHCTKGLHGPDPVLTVTSS